ncbi:MAG TPA: c-type cytochrome domain-containing protein, partial [Terriglobia bacterium]|nr:c-type cytochrome domain-containing protein [Terriglobia bacterium]
MGSNGGLAADVLPAAKKRMRRFRTQKLRCLVCFAACAFGLAAVAYPPARALQNTAPPGAASSRNLDFSRDILPILSDKCFACHGPDAPNNKSPLRFDTEAHAFTDLGEGRRAIVRGHPEQSELVRRITAEEESLRMPPVYSTH